MKREVELRALGYNLVAKWENEFCNENNSNQSLSKFVEGLDIQDRLNNRASFFFSKGGQMQRNYTTKQQEIKQFNTTILQAFIPGQTSTVDTLLVIQR